MKHIIDERYEVAKSLLSENRDMLDKISAALLERETIDEKEFDELMDSIRSERGNQ